VPPVSWPTDLIGISPNGKTTLTFVNWPGFPTNGAGSFRLRRLGANHRTQLFVFSRYRFVHQVAPTERTKRVLQSNPDAPLWGLVSLGPLGAHDKSSCVTNLSRLRNQGVTLLGHYCPRVINSSDRPLFLATSQETTVFQAR